MESAAPVAEWLLERDHALAAVGESLAAARTGNGLTLAVIGPAGIGKSSVLNTAKTLADAGGMTILASRGGELERDFPFGVMRQLFESRLRAISTGERRELLNDGAEIVGGLFGLDRISSVGTVEQAAACNGLFWLASNFAEREPLLLTVDDAQWADAGSLAALVYLARRVSDLALLLVVAWRSEEASRLPVLAHLLGLAEEISLAALSASACAELVRRTIPDAVDSFCAACQRLTAGNPFLVEELVREAHSRALSPDDDGALALAELGSQSVERSVGLRLAAVPDAAGALVRALSVLGDGAELRQGAALIGLPIEEALTGFDQLTAAGLLAPVQPVRFVHPLVRQAIYSSLPDGERLARHRRAAAVYTDEGQPTDQVASHLLIAPPAGDEWVVERLREAAGEALRAATPDAAAGFLRRALAEPPPLADRSQLVLALAEAEARAGRAAAIGHLREALATLEDPRQRASVALTLARELEARGDDAGARDALAGALNDAASDRELELLISAELLLLETTSSHGVGEEISKQIWRTARAISGTTLPERAVLGAYGYALGMTGRGTSREAAASARQALQDETMIEQLGLVSLLMEPTMILIVTDPPDDLPERIVERGYELAGRNGSPLEAIIAYTLGCYLWWLRGQLVRAEGDGETSVRIAREHQFATSIQMTVGYQLRVLADRGMLDEADELLDQTLPERVPVATNRAAHATLLSGAAHLHLARGRWEQALISARQVGELAAGRESCGPISAWRAWAAMALVGLGRTDEASQIATEQLEIAHRWASARAVGQALHALALTQAAQQRISTLQAAVDVLRSRPVPLELARALLELGASHRRRGERRAARLPLAEALEIAARCHSGLLTEVATTELHAAGARPRRPMRSGIDALTPTELRIATMAARGLSNPQIAQALFVTRKTVEAHLSHVYLKLSVRSRSQLQAALGRRERSDL